MTPKTQRTGAIASAVTLFAVFLGTGLTGAIAQDQAELSELEMTESTDTTLENAAPAVRFVSHAVVQEIPEDQDIDADAPLASANQAIAGEAASLHALVDTLPLADAMSEDMRCLAQAVYFESRGEPLDGQLAVARVVINRAESNLFPDDYCSVVTQRAQFSFVRGGRIPAPNAGSDAWHRARTIARIAHQELWDSEAGESLYFHAAHVSPRWSRNKAAVARIDSHIFYR